MLTPKIFKFPVFDKEEVEQFTFQPQDLFIP